MIRLIQNRLIIPQGDTGTLTVPVLPNLNTGDVAVFTIFDSVKRKKIFQKIINEFEENTLSIRLEHSDTVDLPVGKFYWDIKFYQEPVFDATEKLVNGTEVDSYYAAYSLPICEIRMTGENFEEDISNSNSSSIITNYLDLKQLYRKTLELESQVQQLSEQLVEAINNEPRLKQ